MGGEIIGNKSPPRSPKLLDFFLYSIKRISTILISFAVGQCWVCIPNELSELVETLLATQAKTLTPELFIHSACINVFISLKLRLDSRQLNMICSVTFANHTMNYPYSNFYWQWDDYCLQIESAHRFDSTLISFEFLFSGIKYKSHSQWPKFKGC